MARRRNVSFDTVRDDLLGYGLYLGDQNFEIDKVVWQRIGTENCLVTKESADAVDAALAAAPEEDAPIPEYDPAVLSAVVHISNDHFWMTPCGHWNGPRQHCERFSDVELTCTGKSPSGTPLSKDFPTVLANLTAVANLPAKLSNKKGLFVERPPTDRKIKFRHVLFEVSIRLLVTSLVKLQFINLVMNRSSERTWKKKIHLDQRTTVSNTTLYLL